MKTSVKTFSNGTTKKKKKKYFLSEAGSEIVKVIVVSEFLHS